MTQETGTVQLSVTSQQPSLWHLLNFQVCVKQRNRQFDNTAFISYPKSLHNQPQEKKKEQLRGGIENVKSTF